VKFMTFLDRLDMLCKEKNISKRKLEREAGLGTASTTKWKKEGSVPNQTSLEKLSEYLGVSVSFLIGESDFRTEQDAVIDGWNKRFGTDSLKDEVKRIENGIKIPVVGTVPCGIPIEAIELVDADDWEEIPEKLARTGKFFGLKVKGDSMSPRILDGDVVIVRQQSVAESGDIVIAKVNGDEATCKKLVKYENGISLVPYNSMYEPMYFSNEDIAEKPVTIIGKVVELRGKF
jgi:repressor LexA